MLRKRQVPVIGNGAGIGSFLHVQDAASAAVAALESRATGVFNIVDDEPAPVSEWLPALAAEIGAKSPLRIPAWLARLAAGEAAGSMMTRVPRPCEAQAQRDPRRGPAP